MPQEVIQSYHYLIILGSHLILQVVQRRDIPFASKLKAFEYHFTFYK